MQQVNKPERISPLFNDLFLKVFGSKGSEPITMSLVNAIFRKAGIPEITRIDKLVAESAGPGGLSLKTPRFDVVIQAEDDRIVDLEAQRRRVNSDNKALFYASKLYCEHVDKGTNADYNIMPQVISLTLHEGQSALDDDCWLSVGRLKWNRDGIEVDGTDRLLFVSIEIDKLKGRYNGADEKVRTDELTAWMYVLADGYKDEEGMAAIMDSFPTIEQFAEMYGIAIDDPDIKRSYDKYFESVIEWNSMVSEARKDIRKELYGEVCDQVRNELRGEVRDQVRNELRQEVRDEVLQEVRQEDRKTLAARLKKLGIDDSIIEAALAD